MRRTTTHLTLLALLLGSASAGCAGSSRSSHTPTSQRATREFSPEVRVRIDAVDGIVERVARSYRLDADLLRGMIWVESRFDPKATSPAGAKGLMQLMPATSRSLADQLGRRSRPYNAEFNVTAGALYLRKMIDRFDGDVDKAIAAYNAGPGNVSKWTRGGRRLPERSRSYVDKVMTARGYFTDRRLNKRRLAAAAMPRARNEVAGETAPVVPPAPARPPRPPRRGRPVLPQDFAPIDEAPVFERHPIRSRRPATPPEDVTWPRAAPARAHTLRGSRHLALGARLAPPPPVLTPTPAPRARPTAVDEPRVAR